MLQVWRKYCCRVTGIQYLLKNNKPFKSLLVVSAPDKDLANDWGLFNEENFFSEGTQERWSPTRCTVFTYFFHNICGFNSFCVKFSNIFSELCWVQRLRSSIQQSIPHLFLGQTAKLIKNKLHRRDCCYVSRSSLLSFHAFQNFVPALSACMLEAMCVGTGKFLPNFLKLSQKFVCRFFWRSRKTQKMVTSKNTCAFCKSNLDVFWQSIAFITSSYITVSNRNLCYFIGPKTFT